MECWLHLEFLLQVGVGTRVVGLLHWKFVLQDGSLVYEKLAIYYEGKASASSKSTPRETMGKYYHQC